MVPFYLCLLLLNCRKTYTSLNTETKMSSFWQNFHHWLHRKLSFWQLSVQPVNKISSKWQHFCSIEYVLITWHQMEHKLISKTNINNCWCICVSQEDDLLSFEIKNTLVNLKLSSCRRHTLLDFAKQLYCFSQWLPMPISWPWPFKPCKLKKFSAVSCI